MERKISVIVSIYNVERYISQCIESIIKQTYLPYEVLLVNDGSKDQSLSICKKYEEQYPNMVKVIDKKNGGLSSARNAGLKISGGMFTLLTEMTIYCLKP